MYSGMQVMLCECLKTMYVSVIGQSTQNEQKIVIEVPADVDLPKGNVLYFLTFVCY